MRLLGAYPTGHEEETLNLMKKRDVKRVQGKEKKSQGNSKFDRDEKIGVDSRGEEEKKKWRTSKRGEGSLFSLLIKITILSWNVRGANDVVKRKVVKAFLKSQKVDMVCIQETKLKEISRGIISSLSVGRYMEWVVSYAKRASGGILIL